MTKVANEVRINAPKEQVWETLADFGGIHVFSPGVRNSYSTNDLNSGVGATRHCDLATSGSSIEERIVEWVDGEKMVVEIYDGKKAPPFKTAFATIDVRDDGPDNAVVRGSIEYSLKMGAVGALMDATLIKPQFSKGFGGLLAGLKHYTETGEPVDGLEGLDLAAVQNIAA
jgi:uncharacterized protein YndB with AHSA1/START domain